MMVAVLADGRRMPYDHYLRSPEWAVVRRSELARSRGRCTRRGKPLVPQNYHCHHVSYKRLGHERPDDVRAMCVRCHRKEHGRLAQASRDDRLAARPVMLTASEARRRGGRRDRYVNAGRRPRRPAAKGDGRAPASPCCRRPMERTMVDGYLDRWLCPCGWAYRPDEI